MDRFAHGKSAIQNTLLKKRTFSEI